MKEIRRLSFCYLRKNSFRTAMILLGIVVSAMFLMAVATVVLSFRNYLVRGYLYEKGDWFVSFDGADEEQVLQAAADPKTTEITALSVLGYVGLEDRIGSTNCFELAAAENSFFEMMSVPLVEGRLPENGSEILLPVYFRKICEYYQIFVPEIGDRITLEVFQKEKPLSAEYSQDRPEERIQKAYTVVGWMENRNYREVSGFYELLTAADGNEGEAGWYRLFLKCARKDAESLALVPYGMTAEKNTNLLQAYGITGYENVNQTVFLLGAAVILIIMTASIGLIRNAFTVSVTERTRELGLLSGIGTTHKQNRRLILYEALILMGIGVPAGLLLGYGLAAVFLRILREPIRHYFSFGGSDAVLLRADLSFVAVLCAALLCMAVIGISALSPAQKAAKITPIDAIRNRQGYREDPKKRGERRFKDTVPNVPAALAERYFRAGKKRFFAASAALFFSLVLFISASGFFNETLKISDAINVSTEQYDMVISASGATSADEMFSEVRRLAGIERSAVTAQYTSQSAVPSGLVDAVYKEWHAKDTDAVPDSGAYRAEQAEIFYLEDEVLKEALLKEGIDPAPYLDGKEPLALSIPQTIRFFVKNDEGKRELKVFSGYVLSEDAKELFCRGISDLPEELQKKETDAPINGSGTNPPPGEWPRYSTDEAGNWILETGPNERYLLRFQEKVSDHEWSVSYHRMDPVSGQAAETPAAEQVITAFNTGIGERLKSIPFGMENTQTSMPVIGLVMPLSKKPAGCMERLFLKVSDREDFRIRLNALKNRYPDMEVWDLHEGEDTSYRIALLMRVFAYAFIVLIGLVACMNVFNTVYTGQVLKKRDFGMLRSIGFRRKDLMMMILIECVRQGLSILIPGILAGLACCYAVHRIVGRTLVNAFEVPWGAVGIGVLFVFVILISASFLAVFFLRKETPVDAIRSEQI